jgi:hypothetical protein
MTSAERYRKSAAQLRAKARNEKSHRLKVEWESRLADCYTLLAERADRNSRIQVVTSNAHASDSVVWPTLIQSVM